MIQNPHDKFFKETFGRVEVAKDFLNNYLPQNVMDIIDVDTLEPQKDSFINDELKESFSDLLFKVDINKREGYIYFIFEHKSYPSKDISFQLLKYMMEIWEAKINKEGTKKLPIIIPLVIYHGKAKWNIKTTLGEMITGYEELPKDIQKHIPDYEYLLYDLSGYPDEEIKGEAINQIAMTIMRDIFTTYPEGSEVVMTLAEKLRQEGMEKGIEKGETKALIKTAIKLLTRKFGILPEDLKRKISKLDTTTLEIIIEDILDYQSLEDIKKYIDE